MKKSMYQHIHLKQSSLKYTHIVGGEREAVEIVEVRKGHGAPGPKLCPSVATNSFLIENMVF